MTELAISHEERIAKLESLMLGLDSAPECPVVHHFGPNICIREVTIPKGMLAVGHKQKYEHLNVLLKGSVAMLGDNGEVTIVSAPLIFTGKAGRKLGVTLEDTVWQNIYSTELKTVEQIEAHFIDKSEQWIATAAESKLAESILREEDRQDYLRVIAAVGMTEDEVRVEAENESDRIDIDPSIFAIKPSPIEGVGVFLTCPVDAFQVIGPARLSGKRTQLGRFTNHSKSPNAFFVKNDQGDIYLMSLRRIDGCRGGSDGEEITVDYYQAMKLNGANISEVLE